MALTCIAATVLSCGENWEVQTQGAATRAALTEYGGEKRTLRLAVAATAQHLSAYDNVNDLTSSIETWVGDLNAFLIPTLAVEFELVANDGSLISTDFADALSVEDGDLGELINQSKSWIDGLLGTGGYDVGLTLASAAAGEGNGRTFIGAYCNTVKGGTALSSTRVPVSGTILNLQLHQIGHVLGALHTHNSSSGLCDAQRSTNFAVEPGAGVTLMSFAGICSPDNTGGSRIRQFHSVSLDEITDRLDSRSAPTCGTATAVSNTPPTVTVATASAQIPRGTPFVLEGSATDTEDQNNLLYSWEQIDVAGRASTLADGDLGDVPLFRVFPADSSPNRTFPRDPLNPEVGEILPTTTRTLTFRLLAADQNPLGGAYSSAETTLEVIGSAGPFLQTTPNTSWVAGVETVTWNIAGTSDPPIGCANVDITLSADGGATFDTVLAENTPNDGSQEITVPPVISNDATVRVKCSTNVFFSDIAVTIDGTQCSVDGDCDDGNVCNGAESCVGIECVPGTPLDCDDGLFCNGEETCDAVAGCGAGTPPILDDGDDCTADRCDEDADEVVNDPIAGCGMPNMNDNANENENDNAGGNTNDNTTGTENDNLANESDDGPGENADAGGCGGCNGVTMGWPALLALSAFLRRRKRAG